MLVLLENEFLNVVFSGGSSEYLLIAFSPMNFQRKDSKDFYAKSIIQNNNVNAVSIMATKNHWYPKQIMQDVIPNIIEFSGKFKYVVMYGVSMGGYAAVKYSKEFGATHVISMMPQWTINPNEFPEYRYIKEYQIFADYLSDMSIKSTDVSGNLHIFYDNYYWDDKIQAQKIIDLFAEKSIYVTPFVGHTLGYILVGSSFFALLVQLILANQNEEIGLAVKKKIKNHPLKLQGVIKNALPNHSELLTKLIEKMPENHIMFCNPVFREEVKKILKTVKEKERAIHLALRFSYLDFFDKMRLVILKSHKGNFAYTAHNNFLCYNIIDEKLVQIRENELNDCWFVVPIKFNFDVGILGFFVDFDLFLPLISTDDGRYVLANNEWYNNISHYRMQPFLFYRRLSNFYVISDGVFHATATPKQTIDFGKSHIKDWEKFTSKQIYC